MKTMENSGTTMMKSGSVAWKVAGGVLAGAAAGAIAGVLLAPDSGKNTRKKIAVGTKKMVDDVKSKTTDTINSAKESIKNVTNKMAHQAERLEESLN